MNKLSLLGALTFGLCSAFVYAQDNSVAAVEARAQSSTNAGPVENLTPDIIGARLDTTLKAAIAEGRRPDPALIPPLPAHPMTWFELRALVEQNQPVGP